MLTRTTIVLLSIFSVASCTNQAKQVQIEEWKQEILEAEKSFERMAAEEGIAEAFIAFADDEAVLMRNNRLIEGKQKIMKYFSEQTYPNSSVKLTWQADFVAISASGDLGYTYGKYQLAYSDSSGKKTESDGVFHTVWKRQYDNSWKFVWD